MELHEAKFAPYNWNIQIPGPPPIHPNQQLTRTYRNPFSHLMDVFSNTEAPYADFILSMSVKYQENKREFGQMLHDSTLHNPL